MKKEGVKVRLFIVFVIFFSITVSSEYTKSKKSDNNQGMYGGKLIKMFNSGGYKYLQYESEGKTWWAASKTVVANIGDIIEFKNPLVMKKFHSRTLNKTFDLIYFAGLVRAVGKPGSQKKTFHPVQVKKKPEIVPGIVKKVAGGFTIGECFDPKSALGNKTILIRAVVVKVSPNIKGKNWIHIRDGSGQPGKNDLTVTTKKSFKPGDIVLVKGKLILNKNIGSGYIFPGFMEEPEISKENK